ncbi:MAG: 2-C-methyl-D-erythritol 4-phosphate cytidylyltransferase, partial [Synergistaceae bacterium]|nr:2-C-methyl-D-erythritol 4-phosphate cytidylyltransferase [Synergistaceae bacterium]
MSEKHEKSVSFIIVAGGKGSRMGGEKKQFMLLNGRPLWRWSYDILTPECVKESILVIPQGSEVNHVPENLTVPLKIAYGGKERAESVLNGLKEASCDYVLVHDAARPFLSMNLIHSLIDAVDESHGAVPVLPVSDALKKIDGDNISCINRDGLYITQTPQSFPREKLIYAVSKNPGAKDE